jgi:hypothetical protein
MKRIRHLLLVLLVFIATVLSQEALAGSCGPTGCNIDNGAPSVPSTPSTASSSHAFTATGGARVADTNLSQEAREVINTQGKEAPLPKGFVSAADRAKLIAGQSSLYGWPEDENPRRVARTVSRPSNTRRPSQNSLGQVRRPPGDPKQAPTAKVAVAAKANR